MKKLAALYSGKSKTLYQSDTPNQLVAEFRNDATAFNGQKHSQFANKGLINNHINAFIMQQLEKNGIKTHFVERFSDTESIVKKLRMLPIECVVRNVAAGSICKRLGVEMGTELNPATFEFFLKNDALGDPMINEYHIEAFKWASKDEIKKMTELTFKVNHVLKKLFEDAGMILVDYKLEFGIDEKGEMLLGDEFTPDGCRLWDAKTKQVLDKDIFRRDLGDVMAGYAEVAKRLRIELPVSA